MIPVIYGIMQFDFMGNKVADRLTNAQDISRFSEQFDYHSGKEQEDTYLGSLDRFDAMAFEWLNFMHDPLLGYGKTLNILIFIRKLQQILL